MGIIETRLIELGHPLPEVAKPVAAYIPSVVTGNLVFTSGQLPFVAGALPAAGKVG
ncbi:MAG: RidA family protein, partial [Actinobacteria bacterium]|nr:RidA family protein [Actinomycetota bacterium]